MGSVDRPVWQDIAAQKRSIRAEAVLRIRQEEKVSSCNESLTVSTSCGVELVDKIKSGQLSCEQAARGCISRACDAHERTNCLTEITFDKAINDAKKLDQYLSEHGKSCGPLHGLPVTLKDQFDIASFDSTLGYTSRAFSPAVQDCAIVQMLEKLGAVVLAKTNLPQSIMWCETENPLWGLTTNPKDETYTPGGSTGGEAAVLAMGGSMLGWGTDIGGSIRIPSHMMGLYGLKPSSARLSYHGVQVSTDGQEHVPSAVGPLARSLDTIHLAMKSLIDLKPWTYDTRCVPVPWRQDEYDQILGRPLTIGVLMDDGVVEPHPPISRVFNSVVETLRAAGHDIVEWNADLHPECVAVMDSFYTADGGEDVRREIQAGGEPMIPHVKRVFDSGALPISVYEYWQLNKKKLALQQAYMAKWNEIRSPRTGRAVDVVLMPPMPHSAVPHGGCKWVGYTKVWNLLDYTALVIPAGKVQPEDVGAPWDEQPAEGRQRGDRDEWNRKLWIDNRARMADLQLPVGVQIIGRKLEEEKVLAVGKVIDDLIRMSK